MEIYDERVIHGKSIRFDGSKRYEHRHMSSLDPDDFDFEGDDVETFRPMSELCFYTYARAPGFADFLGGNYAAYLQRWYEARREKPSKLAVHETARQLAVRQRELAELIADGASEGDDQVQLAIRNVAVAEELCDWASAGLPHVSAESEHDLSFYDEYRVKNKHGTPLDYWILHRKLADSLSKLLKSTHSETIRYMSVRHDVPTEIVYDGDDDDDETSNQHPYVVYCGVIPRSHFIVCTQTTGMKMTDTVLDEEETLKRKRLRNQAERDLRKQRRDDGYGVVQN